MTSQLENLIQETTVKSSKKLGRYSSSLVIALVMFLIKHSTVTSYFETKNLSLTQRLFRLIAEVP